ncbi:hypothetical protein PF005_g11223 [Phytophthora fragariae]|uniref:Uncharacterized protein n=2 Tax=Phytophthora TaxID=4783 RepID=A0A6A4DL99_9STRA|nr:hypothetical protein PF003_g39361 [Phytophthora fragariae]KAE8962761.1 hypothetical protein PR001_g29604 [Phytophthora rubi]KAE8937774.1 hypothetical protein PF009_g12335 [Phytophthora fragariae]KAE8967531.1 hypothetical protein PR002_g28035 [Phytophthora rubi]KAE9009721.1 hypothetical protein PF011_g10136 [Phytophthora fragariae]
MIQCCYIKVILLMLASTFVVLTCPCSSSATSIKYIG